MRHGCGRLRPLGAGTFVIVAAILLACAGTARAATKTWVGAGGSWSDGANWSPAGVPAATDDAVIATGNPELSAADASVGSIDLGSGGGLTVSGDHTLTVGSTATSSIAGSVLLSHGTLRLDGTATWSAGDLQLLDAGLVEVAGELDATGAGSVGNFSGSGVPGRRALHVAAGGVVDVTGTISVFSELENDGTLHVEAGGALTQFNTVASPADSVGAFEADGSGALTLSNVVMASGSSASGTGTIGFAGGPSRVAPDAAYSAGITQIGSAGDLDFDAAGSTGALRMSGGGTRRGDGTLTVGGGQSALGGGEFTDAGLTTFSASSHTTIDNDVLLVAPTAGHTLRLNGTTTWSAGSIEIQDAGVVEDAGTLDVTGNVSVQVFDSLAPDGRRALHVLAPDGVVDVTGTISVFSELENDGTVHVEAGGALTQFNTVASPADSTGAFVADGSGALSVSNVVMASGSSASGTGTIAFAGGPSRVVPGAAYAAGITDVGSGGDLDFDAGGSTGALTMSGGGTRRGDGTLTVGSGQSSLGGGVFTEAGLTKLSPTSHTTIDNDVLLVAPTAGHTLRLNGTTTWSAGAIEIQDAGVVEDAGALDVTGNVSVQVFDSLAPDGRRALHVLAGGVVDVTGTVSVLSELENDGTLQAAAGGALTQFNTVASPADSTGAFVANGSGVLTLSNVVMASGSSASGTGTIGFAGGPSRVAPGAAYAAGITSIGSAGDLDLDADSSTGALRFSGGGTRRGTGTLTVGSGQSSLGGGDLTDAGLTTFSPTSHTTIDNDVLLVAPTAGHTLRLNGTTTWSAGAIDIADAGIVENAGALDVTGDVEVRVFDSPDPDGPRELHNTAGTFTVGAGSTLFLGTPLSLQGGTLAGSGVVNGSIDNTGGTVSPGPPPAELHVTQDYTQGPGATLRSDIAGTGTQYDRLVVDGIATLDGTLQLVTASGFTPAAGDAFRILDATDRIGTFATVSGAQATPGERYVPSYDPTGVSLTVGLGPGNTQRPSIPAAGSAGTTVSCDPGTWTGNPSFAFAWLRNGTPVATGPTYTLSDADGGQTIVCRVTATNANGSGQADSNAMTPTARQQPAPTPTPTPTVTPPPPPPPPTTGETVNVAAARGTVTVRRPDGTTVPIDEATQIETGSVIDTREGAVRLDSRGSGGTIQSGLFSEGLFRITQTKGKHPVTVLTLVEKLACPKAATAQAARKRRRKRRLWGDAHGDYRTRGLYGSAVNTGTKWMTEDSCAGTLFRVTRGAIRVTPNGGRRTVTVRAGHRYLVRRPS